MITILILVIINLLIFLNIERINRVFNIYDTPNKKRKIHKNKIANTGGIIIFFNLLLIYFFNLTLDNFYEIPNNLNLNLIFFGLISFFLLGLFDDIYDLNPNLKLFLSSLFILIVILNENDLLIETLRFSFIQHEINLKSFSIPFTLLCILLFINAINMFDGINLQTILYSSLLLISNFILSQNYILILYIVPILIFMMILNYKDIIFLGDSGTLLLGFLLSCIFIINYNSFIIQYSDTIFIFMMLPGLELLRLAISRGLKKRNPFSADKMHIHHLLLIKYPYNKVIIINFIMVLFINNSIKFEPINPAPPVTTK